MDKNKILDAAAKLVAKGAYDKAIKEYQKVLEADPKDVRVLHKLGELYEKKNDNVQAAGFFTKVADGYASDGFSMKAIALYKKVLKLDPNLMDVNLKLAELHQQHQLMSEAMAYFQAVANHHDKSGNVKASLDILKKMVDLDPENVASRIKLADLYAREQMNPEASAEYKRAAEYLKRNNRIDDYLRVAERLSALDPNNLELSRDLAQEYLGRGDQKRALAKLQVCFKADPKDIQTLNLLAQAFQGLNQTSKTISVYKELAKVYSDGGRTNEANGVWSKIAMLDPQDPDVVARSAPKSQPAPAAAQPQSQAQAAAPARAAQPAPQQQAAAPAPAAAAPSGGAGGLTRDQLAKLLTETDVYVKYGLHDKALEHLRRVFGVDPENLDAHEKAYNIYVAANNTQAAAEQLLNVLRLCTRRHEVQRAQPYLQTILQQNPNHPEVPAFLQVLRTGAPAQAAAAPEEPVAEDAILVDSTDEEIIVADAPEDALPEAHDLALQQAARGHHDVVAEDVIEEPALVAEDPVVADAMDEPLAVTGDEPLVMDEPVSAEIVVEDDDEPQTVETSGVGLGDEDEHSAPTTMRPLSPEMLAVARGQQAPAANKVIAPPTPARAEPPPPAPAPKQVGKEVTRTNVKAPPEPARPVTAAPAAPPAPPAGKKGAAIAPPPPMGLGEDDDQPTGSFSVAGGLPAPAEAEEPAGEECDEAQFFLDQGITDEAREILETVMIAYPGHKRAAELMERLEALEAQGGAVSTDEAETPAAEEVEPPPVQPVAPDEPGLSADADAGGRDAFDLAAELADELGDLGGVEEAAPAGGGDEYQVSVDEVFSEFKKGLQKIVKPEDVDTHYDLGIAYKEMGLIDDAIGEFTVARQGCVGKKKELDCLTMMGMLQLMKGDAMAAVDSFKQALGSEHSAADAGKALRFELALAWEAAGSPGKALFHFQAVNQADPKFRDVADQLKRLAGTKPETDDFPAPGSNGAAAAKNGTNGAGKNGAPAAKPAGGAVATGAQKPASTGPKSGKVGYV